MLWPYHTKDKHDRTGNTYLKKKKKNTVKINKMTTPQFRIFVLRSTNTISCAT